VSAEIAPSTTLGAVHLTITDLARSIEYYQQVLGLTLLDRGTAEASLGVDERELLVLVEEPEAWRAAGHSGLYHFALLLPRREQLAAWLAHAARDRVALVGLSDHFVSEAIYLSDPDGHGIEIYWDRPREVWEGQVATRMTTRPLGERGSAAAATGQRRAHKRDRPAAGYRGARACAHAHRACGPGHAIRRRGTLRTRPLRKRARARAERPALSRRARIDRP
jgi:catechol-2,3-dioxygenase